MTLIVSGFSQITAGKKRIEGVDFTLAEGRTLAIMGPSGSGKSSLLRCLAGIETPTCGMMSWAGVSLVQNGQSLIPAEGRTFSLVMQEGVLFPHLDVLGNVTFGISGASKTRRLRLACRSLKSMNALHLARRSPGTLSGGERQRVALARALAPEPTLLLLDEPFAGVDCLVRHQLVQTLQARLRGSSLAAIIVTHELRDALDLADDILILRDGKAVQQGTASEVIHSPIDDWTRSFLNAGRTEHSFLRAG